MKQIIVLFCLLSFLFASIDAALLRSHKDSTAKIYRKFPADDSASNCPKGYEIPSKEDCELAVDSFLTITDSVQDENWSSMPCGCLQDEIDGVVYFNRGGKMGCSTGQKVDNSNNRYSLICKRFVIPDRSSLLAAVDNYLSSISITTSGDNNNNIGYPIGLWDVSAITDFSSCFDKYRNFNATMFNADISQWDVSNAVDMSYMFKGASSFNRDLIQWDTSKVTSMMKMFDVAISFNGNISTWDTSKVTTMKWMFRWATSFNGDISNWDTASVISMASMFYRASAFNGNIANWDISKQLDISQMFWEATSFNRSLCSWGSKLRKSAITDNMFVGTSCPSKGDPVLFAVPSGPFCHECRDFGLAPLTMTTDSGQSSIKKVGEKIQQESVEDLVEEAKEQEWIIETELIEQKEVMAPAIESMSLQIEPQSTNNTFSKNISNNSNINNTALSGGNATGESKMEEFQDFCAPIRCGSLILSMVLLTPLLCALSCILISKRQQKRLS